MKASTSATQGRFFTAFGYNVTYRTVLSTRYRPYELPATDSIDPFSHTRTKTNAGFASDMSSKENRITLHFWRQWKENTGAGWATPNASHQLALAVRREREGGIGVILQQSRTAKGLAVDTTAGRRQ